MLTSMQRVTQRSDGKAGASFYLFFVDSARDRILGSSESSSSSSQKLTFGRLPFCFPGNAHPFAAAASMHDAMLDPALLRQDPMSVVSTVGAWSGDTDTFEWQILTLHIYRCCGGMLCSASALRWRCYQAMLLGFCIHIWWRTPSRHITLLAQLGL